ncbi:hypothetical protein IW261DRAFT_186567 [Armillaria novae-zelandiae]|uniref:Uncharacterized protein n=1 Tax=Armillaria novae-zelandiae TaxID=153914 RepID=A0AA39P7M8_9AGAR|nr:hypothetical protein IW261DRAFT_186567 [Armillaria novae-zelandiae]
MLRKFSRKLVKSALWWSRLKLVCTRIILTRFTLLYTIVALLTCIVLASLQGLAYHDNSDAANLISDILNVANVTNGLTILSGNVLQYCHDIPSEPDANCVPIRPGNSTFAAGPGNTTDDDDFVQHRVSAHSFAKRDGPPMRLVTDGSGATVGVVVKGNILTVPCLRSFHWLGDVLQDSRREDVVTLLYQIWMLSLSIVAILNESLPHLGASLAGHVLGTAWAGFRVSSSKHLQERYNQLIVHDTCDEIDLLQNWWSIRTKHTVPVVVLNVVALLTLLFLSANLYKVYANQSFSRVGGSPEINRIYKFVLLLSVILQLAGFFTLAATGMWIDKISGGSIRRIQARHRHLYIAAFGVTAALDLPWVVLGWISVRREYRRLFIVFGALSIFLLGISTFMFASNLYRFIFMSWPFFATMTVTTYILLVATSALGVVCRLHFDKGLAQFLRVSDALEGMDFTPAYFSKNINDVDNIVGLKRSASEKSYASSKKVPIDEEMPDIQEPSEAYFETRAGHSLSVYSDANRPTMKFTSTPKVARSQRASTASTATALTTSTTSTYSKQPRSTTKAAWKEHSNRSATPLVPIPQREDEETASLGSSIVTVVRKETPVIISTPKRMKSSQAKDTGVKSTSPLPVSKDSTPQSSPSSVLTVVRQTSPDSPRGPRLPATPRPSKRS